MSKSGYAVMSDEIGEFVWAGLADSALQACRESARADGVQTTGFQPYEFTPPSHKDDGVERLVLTVYAFPDWTEVPTIAALDHLDRTSLEDRVVGTYMALYA